MNSIKVILKILAIFLTIVYPFVVYYFLANNYSLTYLSLILLLTIVMNFTKMHNFLLLGAGLLTVLLMTIYREQIFFKLYPIMMNGIISLMFLISLRKEPLITTFARKMHYEITPAVYEYTKNVTVAWSVFMLFNTLISLSTVFMPDFIWAIYNGFISYMLIALMFLMEFLYRKKYTNV